MSQTVSFWAISCVVCQPLAMLSTQRAVLNGMAKGVPHFVGHLLTCCKCTWRGRPGVKAQQLVMERQLVTW